MSYGYRRFGPRTVRSLFVFGLPSFGLNICRRRNKWLCKSYFILTFPLRSLSYVYSRSDSSRYILPCCRFLRSFCSHMVQCDDHWLCKSEFILILFIFEMCHFFLEFWTSGRCFAVWLLGLCSISARKGRALMIGSVSLTSLGAHAPLQCVFCSLTFWFWDGALSARFMSWVVLMRTWINANIFGHVGINTIFL